MADIFVLPASQEPASVAVLEAIANGTPAICSDTCGTQDYIREGKNGFVFESDRAEDLERVLRRCFENPEQLSRMNRLCIEWAREEISSDAYYKRLQTMIRDRWPAEFDRW